MGPTILPMQAMQIFTSGGVTMAAGAMISLTLALSPPLTVLPPIPMPANGNGEVISQGEPTAETVGEAAAETFESRWQAASDTPQISMEPRDQLEGLVGGLLTLPLAPDPWQVMRIAPHQFTAAPHPAEVLFQE